MRYPRWSQYNKKVKLSICFQNKEPKAVLYTCDFGTGHGDLTGKVNLSVLDGEVSIEGTLAAKRANTISDGVHAFHVHANAVISPDCGAAGGHFKSLASEIHGFPSFEYPERYVGLHFWMKSFPGGSQFFSLKSSALILYWSGNSIMWAKTSSCLNPVFPPNFDKFQF